MLFEINLKVGTYGHRGHHRSNTEAFPFFSFFFKHIWRILHFNGFTSVVLDLAATMFAYETFKMICGFRIHQPLCSHSGEQTTSRFSFLSEQSSLKRNNFFFISLSKIITGNSFYS